MKNDYTFSFLRPQDMPELHQTFLKAFADYLIPIQLSTEQFNAKVKREGVVPSFCVAAYKENEMVGFIITGLGEWKGQPTAYNAGTGVVPEHRGNQLTKRLYQFLLPKLKESSVSMCLLEVIRENSPAINTYKSLGFEITRTLDCFRARKDELIFPSASPEGIAITHAKKPDWTAYQSFCRTNSSWQNTAVAFNHYPENKLVLEARTTDSELIGFIAFIVGNGAILQLAVHPDFREHGVGSILLREAVGVIKSPAIIFTNIENSATDLIGFLNRRHFKRFLTQYEMIMPAY